MTKPRAPKANDAPPPPAASEQFVHHLHSEPMAYSIKLAASVIGVDETTMQMLIDTGKIRAGKIGTSLVLRRQDLQALVDNFPILQEDYKPATAEQTAEPEKIEASPKASTPPPLALRVKGAAAAISVSTKTIYQLVAAKRIPVVKLGGITLILWDDLRKFLLAAAGREPSLPPPAPPAPQNETRPKKQKLTPPEPQRPKTPPPPILVASRRRTVSPDKMLRTPSPALAAIIGPGPFQRPDAMARLWAYIRAHRLQSDKDARVIMADDKLKGAFGLERIRMFDLNKLLVPHLPEPSDEP